MAKYVFVTGGVTSSLGKGITAASIGRLLKARGLSRLHPQARPVHQRRPGHDVALPARRGLRHRRRRRDGPRPGPLRAVHRREPDPALQRHDRPHLPGRHRQGAPRRLPGRHGPGHPAHHQRDQGADPAAWPATATPDVVIVEVGGTVGDIESLPFLEAIRQMRKDVGRRQRAVRPRHAAAGAGRHRRAQDQAHPALRQGAARHRHPARRHRPALGPSGQRRDPREDRPVHATSPARRSSRPRRPTRSTRCRSCSRRPASATSSSASSASATPPSRPDLRAWRALVERSSGPSRASRSPSSASTSSCPTPTCRSPRRSSTPAGRTASTPRSAGSTPRR